MTDERMPRTGERMPRTALRIAAVAFALQAVGLGALLLVGRDTVLPVVALFGDRVVPIADLRLVPALLVLLAVGAAGLAFAGSRAMLLGAWSQGAGILVVLVARLNTLADAATLIALFALAAGAVCVQISDHDTDRSTWSRPGAWAAAIGLVPWGVIAFGQIGSGLAGEGPGLGIRVITLLALALAALGWWEAWRRAVPTAVDVAMTTVGLSAVVWGLVAVA